MQCEKFSHIIVLNKRYNEGKSMQKAKFELTVGTAALESEDPECGKNRKTNCRRSSYGLKMTVESGGESSTAEFPDITYSRSEMADFISMLERNDVSPVHVEELIDDFFYSW